MTTVSRKRIRIAVTIMVIIMVTIIITTTTIIHHRHRRIDVVIAMVLRGGDSLNRHRFIKYLVHNSDETKKKQLKKKLACKQASHFHLLCFCILIMWFIFKYVFDNRISCNRMWYCVGCFYRNFIFKCVRLCLLPNAFFLPFNNGSFYLMFHLPGKSMQVISLEKNDSLSSIINHQHLNFEIISCNFPFNWLA